MTDPGPKPRRGPRPWLVGVLTGVYLFALLALTGVTADGPALGLTALSVVLAFATLWALGRSGACSAANREHLRS